MTGVSARSPRARRDLDPCACRPILFFCHVVSCRAPPRDVLRLGVEQVLLAPLPLVPEPLAPLPLFLPAPAQHFLVSERKPQVRRAPPPPSACASDG